MEHMSAANSNVNNIVVNNVMPIPARNQRPWIIRAIYFLLIGWWFSALWLSLAWFIAITIIGLPVAQSMFMRVNATLTLQRLK